MNTPSPTPEATPDGAPQPGPGAPAGPGHLVVTVHGIRTYGRWQERLKALLEGRKPGIRVLNYKYGYFSSIAFVVPFMRWLVAWRFRRELNRLLAAEPPGTTVDIVAHSFGTYLAAMAVKGLPEGRHVRNVILAGSVLRSTFPWHIYTQGGDRARVERLVNDCGINDSILVVCQIIAPFLGMAGRIGFNGIVSDRFENRFFAFGHGGYFIDDSFMNRYWVPVIADGERPIPFDARELAGPVQGFSLFLLNNLEFFKILSLAAIGFLIFLLPFRWMQGDQTLRQLQRVSGIARLANAAQIPGRDPDHVQELLAADLKGYPIDPVIQAESGMSSKAERDDSLADAITPQQPWWTRIPGLYDWDLHTRTATTLHAQANAELTVHEQSTAADLERASLLFQQALRFYKDIEDQVPGASALCRLEYGRVLTQLNQAQRAIDVFSEIEQRVWDGQDNALKKRELPPSLMVDALTNKADAYQKLEEWDRAKASLETAASIAANPELGGGDPKLVAFVHNRLAWFHMNRLDLASAEESFNTARRAYEAQGSSLAALQKIYLYHVKHGLAMIQRFRGKPRQAFQQYTRLVGEMGDALRDEDTFTPKQRRDLRDRLSNSSERLADCLLFQGFDYPTWPEASPDQERPERLAYQFLDQAYDLVREDDRPSKARLLYKRFLADFLASPESDATYAHGLFKEAERTFTTLSVQQQRPLEIIRRVATFCRDHRASASKLIESPDPEVREADIADNNRRLQRRLNARAELRAAVQERLPRVDSLPRDDQELLLFASELLISSRLLGNDLYQLAALAEAPIVAPAVDEAAHAAHVPSGSDPLSQYLDNVRADTNRLLTITGVIKKNGAHQECDSYVARYDNMALASTNKIGRLLSAPGPERPRMVATNYPCSLANHQKDRSLRPSSATSPVSDPAPMHGEDELLPAPAAEAPPSPPARALEPELAPSRGHDAPQLQLPPATPPLPVGPATSKRAEPEAGREPWVSVRFASGWEFTIHRRAARPEPAAPIAAEPRLPDRLFAQTATP